ncbi:MAG: DUF4139 domain-containing protein [Bryobacteraceae bacterium]
MTRKLRHLLLIPIGALMAADLPVREIVLYKHGVGYFERIGRLAAGESARLEFKAAEMNDVLKSLMVNEKGGGAVSGIRYDSSQPLAGLPEDLRNLRDKTTLAEVLEALKGSRIALALPSETASGAVVGARVVPGDEKRPGREEVTLLLDSGELRSLELIPGSRIRFADAGMQEQFKEYLAALANTRARDKRSVHIESTGTQSRDIAAGYMIPVPVWKSSYRLVFQEAGPVLEGWAIVDNTTGEDWTNVSLSLVSGRPISFISPLYDPRYISRQVATLPEEMAQTPALHAGAVDDRLKAMAGFAPLPPAPQRVRTEAMNLSTPPAPAKAREVGELFEYRIATPVTIRQNQSAMVPFLQDKVAARKLLIYSDHSSAHPRNAAEITNSTGKTLDGGPVTVFEAGAYGGEALMDTLSRGDKRLISYAIDVGTRIGTQIDSRRDLVREVHLRRGLLFTKAAAVETRTYTIRNTENQPKTLIVEHPVRAQHTVLTPKPVETTAAHYRFEVKLAPDSVAKLPVTEERVYETSVAVASLTPDVLVTYVQNQNLSAAARKELERILEQKSKIAIAGNEIARTEAEINTVVQDQERIRQNLASLNRVSGRDRQVQAYADQLASQETQLAQLRDQLAAQRKGHSALETELKVMFEKLEF